MRGITYLLGAVVALTVVVVYKAHPSGHAEGEAAPIFGIKTPPGYRDWRFAERGGIRVASSSTKR